MPFEMTVHEAFTERLDDGGMRIWGRGEEISDSAIVERLKGNLFVVQRWVDDPLPEKQAAPAPKPLNPAPAPSPAAAS